MRAEAGARPAAARETGSAAVSALRPLVLAALALVSLAIGVVAAEALFRVYEQARLRSEIAIGGQSYDLDRLRFNDHEGVLNPERAPGEFRILSFGDSFAESPTLARYTYAAVAQRRLSEALGRRIRIVNLGRAKTTFPDYEREYRAWSARVEFDAVVFNLYAGNDFREVEPTNALWVGAPRRYRAGAKEGVVEVGPATAVPHRYPLRMLDWARALWLSRRYAAPPTEGYRPGRLMALPAEYVRAQAAMAQAYRVDSISELGDGLQALHDLIDTAASIASDGVPVAITVAPPHFAVSQRWLAPVAEALEIAPEAIRPDLPEQVVHRFAARAGFEGPQLGYAACLRAADAAGEEPYYQTNTHWSIRGNAIVGALLARELALQWFGHEGPLPGEPPPECSTSTHPPTPELEAALAGPLDTIDALEHFRSGPLSQLRDRRFPTPPVLVDALERLGLRHAPERIRGEISATAGRSGTGRSDVRGWAIDLEHPASPLRVGLVARSTIQAAAVTRPRPGRSGAAGAGIAATAPRFRTTLADEALGREIERNVFGFAVADDGVFGLVEVNAAAVKGARRRRPR